MNYFFGIKNSFLNSKLTIPRFQNSNPTKKEYMLFQLEIINQSWKISNLSNIDLNSDFYKIGSSLIGNGNIFCLATKAEILELEKNCSILIDVSGKEDISILSRCLFLRPIIFNYKDDFFDVYHG